MHKTNGCYFLWMPFLQITRGTSPKKGHKNTLLPCSYLHAANETCFTGGNFHTKRCIRQSPVSSCHATLSQVSWGGALRDETKTASKETTRYANTDGKLLILSVVDSTSWRSSELNHTRHATPRCAVKRSINWGNPATAGDPNSVVLKMFERNQFRVNLFTLTIFQL